MRVIALLCSIGLAGCAAHKPATVTIPARCLHEMVATDFADKCVEIPGHPGEATCNNVHIKFSCVEYQGCK